MSAGEDASVTETQKIFAPFFGDDPSDDHVSNAEAIFACVGFGQADDSISNGCVGNGCDRRFDRR
jgi:hypothetical protein